MVKSLGFIVLGFGIGIGLMAAIDSIGTGYRIDEQGTTVTTFDQAFGWGGLLAGSILMLVGVLMSLLPGHAPESLLHEQLDERD